MGRRGGSKPLKATAPDPRRKYEYDPPDGSPAASLQAQGFAKPVQTILDEYWIYVFFRFCAERHRMQDLRNSGVPRDKLSQDETMQRTFVGNVFRELDRGSKRMREELINVGDQTHEEICFRIFLFCSFSIWDTYHALTDGLGYVPRWSTYEEDLPKYEKILYERHQKGPIYTSGFQLVPPTMYFSDKEDKMPHYAASLRFVLSLMKMRLYEQIKACTFAIDASNVLRTVPTLGGFLSLNMLCYLNETPHVSFSYRNFASCGPGARSFLKKMFGSCINSDAWEVAGLSWLQENQWTYWARIGVNPPHAWELGIRPGMRVLDFENALCWCHRYVHDYLRVGYGSCADQPMPSASDFRHLEASAPAWCEEEKHVQNRSKAVLKGDYDELAMQQEHEDESEEVYEVEKVIGRVGGRTQKDGLLRVRWRGYMPEEDTFERISQLGNGAKEAVNEWLEWESRVWNTIEYVKQNYPFTKPKVEREFQEDSAELKPPKRKIQSTLTVQITKKRSITPKKKLVILTPPESDSSSISSKVTRAALSRILPLEEPSGGLLTPRSVFSASEEPESDLESLS